MNTYVDENIESIFFKARQFVEDALEKGSISIKTQKEIVDYGSDLLKHGNPVVKKVVEIARLHRDTKVETKVSPDEKAFFQELFTRAENGELKI